MKNKSIEERAKDHFNRPMVSGRDMELLQMGANFGYQACNEDVVKVIAEMIEIGKTAPTTNYNMGRVSALEELLAQLKTLK